MTDGRPFTDRLANREAPALVPGIPVWLDSSLRAWAKAELHHVVRSYAGARVTSRTALDRAKVLRLERHLKGRTLRGALDDHRDPMALLNVMEGITHNDDTFLNSLDFLVQSTAAGPSHDYPAAKALEGILSEGGSAYTVDFLPGYAPRLSTRVDASVKAGAMESMSGTGRASEHLRSAWSALYGVSPEAGTGYREAVKAVEAAAKPVILPSDGLATLGKMIPAFRDSPERWAIVLTEAGRGTPHGAILAMLEMLWTSQHDRHGTDDESAPPTVTLEEARAALHLALTLVHWFGTGAVRRAE